MLSAGASGAERRSRAAEATAGSCKAAERRCSTRLRHRRQMYSGRLRLWRSFCSMPGLRGEARTCAVKRGRAPHRRA